MPEPDLSRIKEFESPQSLAKWFEQYHASETELWIKIYKKASGIKSVTWDDVVVQSLCWGWIDGIKKSLDTHAYLQRISPRTLRSNWSKRNTKLAEQLISDNKMKPQGLAHVHAAKADGRWEIAYVASEIEVPNDFIDALASEPVANAYYQTLNKSTRYIIAFGLTSAKKPETRLKRFNKFMAALMKKEKPT